MPPRQVLIATYVAFGVAVLAGVYLIATAGWELLLVGAASILAGVLYTGGPRPYGYEGLGEVFVFLFFGVVAVAGSYFAQTEALEWEALVLAVPVGLLASAILVVNNVRDLETDRRAGKRTLAVRLGRERARGLFVAMVVLRVRDRAAAVAARLALAVAAPVAGSRSRSRVPVVRVVRTRTDGPSLNGALAGTGQLQLAFCVLLSAGLLASMLRWACAGPGRRTAGYGGSRSPVRLALRAPLVTAWGELRERELLRVRLTLGDGDFGVGEAAPLEPYDGVSLGDGRARRSTPTRAVLRDADPERRARRAARGVRGRARPAAGARRDRPRAVGPRGPAPGSPVAALLAAGAGGERAGQRDDRRRGPRRRGGGRRPPRRARASAA